LLIQVDPTRRAAMLTAGAQLLGGSAGPILTGFFASETNVAPVLPAAAVLFAATMLFTALAIVPRRARAG
jgi:zinc transporter ZupT